jgi:hypothetical protein
MKYAVIILAVVTSVFMTGCISTAGAFPLSHDTFTEDFPKIKDAMHNNMESLKMSTDVNKTQALPKDEQAKLMTKMIFDVMNKSFTDGDYDFILTIDACSGEFQNVIDRKADAERTETALALSMCIVPIFHQDDIHSKDVIDIHSYGIDIPESAMTSLNRFVNTYNKAWPILSR